MKHFITFYKKKGFHLEEGTCSNDELAYQINHELMKHGYVMEKELFDRVKEQTVDELNELYNDLKSGITEIVGDGNYQPVYKNFPNDTMQITHGEFVINALLYYYSRGAWLPNDGVELKRQFGIEPINYKMIKLLSHFEYTNIFYDIIYSNNSVSAFDKKVIDYYIGIGSEFNLSKIGFKETQAYVGKRLLDMPNLEILPIKDATLVLRLWSTYSGGDEGLKANTKFKLPNNRQRRLLRDTLNQCYNLEESFKTYREKWLRFLFYLNPYKYPTTHKSLAEYAQLLRNNPKQLKTFNSKIEEGFKNKDISVLDLLSKRMGVYTRKLDHSIRVFGEGAMLIWLEGKPNFEQLVIAYNHFTTRDEESDRSAVLAGMSSSEVVTYKSLPPLNSGLVSRIKDVLLKSMRTFNVEHFKDKSVYIDHSLYYRPLAVNNRASSMSLSGVAKGTLVDIPKGKTIRMYVHWKGRSDIDLSGMLINNDGSITKVGWNGQHRLPDNTVLYSGDNTGHSNENAEYIDIDTTNLNKNVEWVIVDAKIYSQNIPTYSSYPKGHVLAGWMLRDKPQQNEHWKPDTVANASVIECEAREVFLMALHMPSRKLVHLDVSMAGTNIMRPEDAMKFAKYLNKLVLITKDTDDIPWKVINQGQILNILAGKIVSDPEDADIVFDDNTDSEEVSRLLTIL